MHLIDDRLLAGLDELRAAVKLLPAGAESDLARQALDLGLAVCAGIAGERLAPALIHQFVRRLCDLLADEGVEIAVGLVLPRPPRLLCA
ncbi:MAG TPA: hypothetical protein VGE07_19955 [Herpetosiphonaceae bacterium]